MTAKRVTIAGDVSDPALRDEVRDRARELGALGHVARVNVVMRVEHRVVDELGRDPRTGLFARGIDTGDNEHIGVDERVREARRERSDSRITMWLEDTEDSLPATTARRADRGLDFTWQMGIVIDKTDAV